MSKLLEEWQNRLGLQEWRIMLVDNCEPDDMTEKAQGYTNWNEVQKTAKIEIIDPQFYGTRVVPFDYEQTLIHELLHLKFTLLQDDENSLQDRITHQLIDDIARALVDAKRQSKTIAQNEVDLKKAKQSLKEIIEDYQLEDL